MSSPDIKYLNKDFSSFKEALIEYAKAYYPTVYNDFSTPSPGTMFIDMASYVGDVLSFYLDSQIQETLLQYAKQPANLYSLAYMLGYRPKASSAAIVELDVYQQLPAITSASVRLPDYNYALVIEEGMQVRSTSNTSVVFYIPEKVDMSLSSSYSPTDISVYAIDNITGQPTSYLIKKTVKAISGLEKTKTFTFGTAERFATATIEDTNILGITSVSDGSEAWYEVPYLAQDYVFLGNENSAGNYPDLYQDAEQVPYIAEKTSVQKRFTSRIKSSGVLQLEFGAGVNRVSSSTLIPDPFNVGIGTINGRTLLNTAFDPTNFVTTEDYGLAPSNTTLTVKYLVGGGAEANVPSNTLTSIVSSTTTPKGTTNPVLAAQYTATLATTNPLPAVGGGDGDTIEDIRLNTSLQFPAQLRAVTQQDYLGLIMSMPSKLGKVAKAFVTKDDTIFRQYTGNSFDERDPLATTLYLLTYNSDGQFQAPSDALYRNIQTYLEEYRMLTDAIILKPAYIVNIGINFDVVLRPGYSSREVLSSCISQLKSFFDRSNWQINEPIILGDLYTMLDKVQGVQTVKKFEIVNLAGQAAGYSEYGYDIAGATLNGVIYPSLDPCIFEVKYPDTDIQGRITTL